MLPHLRSPLMSSMMLMGAGPSGGGGFVGVLDDYTTNLGGWWDVGRALVSGHTGKLIRVRTDALGGAEQDVGIDPATGLLDTAALLSFAGTDSLFVKDIVSSHGTLTQPTASLQMRIVNAGSLVTDSSGRACMEAPGNGYYYYNKSITNSNGYTQLVCCQPVSTTGAACFGGSFRVGDSDLWGIGIDGTDWTLINSIYGNVLTVAGAAAGARKALGTSFDSPVATTWKLRENANNGTVTFGGASFYGSSIQLGSTLSANALRSGDKMSSIVHYDSVLSTAEIDVLNAILVS